MKNMKPKAFAVILFLLLILAALFCGVECVANALRGADGAVLIAADGTTAHFTGFYLIAAGWGAVAAALTAAALILLRKKRPFHIE